MENLPECEICVSMALYLHHYVEWNDHIDKYISKIKEKERNNKIDYINSMIDSHSPYFIGCLEEFEWLYNVEQDTKVKRFIKKCINTITSQK
jgi:hypothetical protein